MEITLDCRSLGRDQRVCKRNGEFTVNIALVKNGKPILGVIFVPVKGWLYYGSSNGSFREIDEKKVKLPFENKSINFKVVEADLIKAQKLKNILRI